jgi:Cu-processing system permease protein
LYFLITENLFLLEDRGGKVILSLFDFTLLIIPIISLFFGVTFINNEKPFIELMLSQPIERGTIFNGLYFGLSLSLSAGMIAGTGLPVLLHLYSVNIPYGILFLFLASSVLLNFIFTGIACIGAFYFSDRAKGLIFVIGFWLFTFIIYDVTVLIISYVLNDYPVEKLMLGLVMLNPVDISRILILLQFDIAALLGYSAAVYHSVFGNTFSTVILLVLLLLWSILPYYIAKRLFKNRDFLGG